LPFNPDTQATIDAARAAGDENAARDLEKLRDRLGESANAFAALSGKPFDWGAVDKARQELVDAMKAAESTVADEMARVQQIDRILAVPAGETGADGTSGGTIAERERLRAERAQLQREIESSIESDPEVQRLRDRRDSITRDIESASAAERGRELRSTPAERAARELASGFNDIIQAAGEDAADTTGLLDRERLAADLSRFANEQARGSAPAIFALADSVANAVLQGPSRAALQATDVSTVDGQRELNRLLRGDDSARDVNIVELEKQNQSLSKLVSLAEDEAKARGITLNWN
jgi:hypothetical protein